MISQQFYGSGWNLLELDKQSTQYWPIWTVTECEVAKIARYIFLFCINLCDFSLFFVSSNCLNSRNFDWSASSATNMLNATETLVPHLVVRGRPGGVSHAIRWLFFDLLWATISPLARTSPRSKRLAPIHAFVIVIFALARALVFGWTACWDLGQQLRFFHQQKFLAVLLKCHSATCTDSGYNNSTAVPWHETPPNYPCSFFRWLYVKWLLHSK